MKKFNKIYYITRTWSVNGSGCGNLRKIYADFLEDYGEVVIVRPNYESNEAIINRNMVAMPYHPGRIVSLMDCYMQYAGMKEDYLDSWVKASFHYLINAIKKDDLVFATSGGELACIKLGAKLKEQTGCKLIINFRDPVDGGIRIGGSLIPGYRGISREKKVGKYLTYADIIVTSSLFYKEMLDKQFANSRILIVNHYLGYVNKVDLKEKKCINRNKAINVVYSGSMGILQGADMLYRSLKDLEGVNIIYICKNPEEARKKMPGKNVKCIPLMKNDQYLKYMLENSDVGFVSLRSDFCKVFVPSKIFEYINLGIPILGALPKSDASEIIESNGYGIVCDYDDFEQIREAVYSLSNKEKYEEFSENIYRDREKWHYVNRKKEFDGIMDYLG